MTADQFRESALALPGASEQSHMKHPDFRVGGRIFASLLDEERSGGLNLSPEMQTDLMRAQPGAFKAAAGAWGRDGWTIVRLADADRALVRAALELAHERTLEKARQRTARRPAKPIIPHRKP